MSVLIKGMDMPKSCDVCPLIAEADDYHVCYINEQFIPWEWVDEHSAEQRHPKPSWCPLVEIPPHGRLIDAVERKKGKWEDNTKDESWKCSECGFIFYSVGFYNIYNTKFRMRFCPNCGADMRGRKDG